MRKGSAAFDLIAHSDREVGPQGCAVLHAALESEAAVDEDGVVAPRPHFKYVGAVAAYRHLFAKLLRALHK